MKKIVLWGVLWIFACSAEDGKSTVSSEEANPTDIQEEEDGRESTGDGTASNRDTESGFEVGKGETDSETSNPRGTGSESEEDTETVPSADDDTEQQDEAVEFTLKSEKDAVSSYLMDARYSAWNYFFGDAVPIGRKWSSIGDGVSFHTALRFADIDIPQGAEILTAELYLTPLSSVQNSNNLWINVYANRSGDCSAFDTGNYETNRPDQRLRTDNYIDHWLIRCNDSCTDLTEYDCQQRKMDCWSKDDEIKVPKELKDIVGEVIALDDWVSGNAMCLFLFNAATDQDGSKYDDRRTIIGYSEDDASGAPRLRIVYKVE